MGERCKKLGLKVMDWNSGQASPDVCRGQLSLFRWTQEVPRDLADRVASEFESLAVRSARTQQPWWLDGEGRAQI